MEIAIPHVVVRVCGPGVGTDLIAVLGVHHIEVSEARDSSEMRRVSAGRPAILVVVVDPPDPHALVSEAWEAFPGVPILIVSDAAQPFVPGDPGRSGWVDTIRGCQPLQDLCWFVLDAVSRAVLVPGLAEHPLGPYRIEVDDEGIVITDSAAADLGIATLPPLRRGDSLPALADPLERKLITEPLRRMQPGETLFRVLRLVDDRGRRHVTGLGMRRLGDGRVAVLSQPLTACGPIVGRHANPRDPITGLMTRWAMSRALDSPDGQGPSATGRTLVLIALDDFAVISHYIGHAKTDDVLLGVASALHRVFPHPALTSRLMGDTFLACSSAEGKKTVRQRAERLLKAIGRIEVPGFAPRFALRASIGVADVADGDHDLALRLAEAAVCAAHAAGGNRVVVAEGAVLSAEQAGELTASMERGSWEVWLQPVVRDRDGTAAYHEALARFDAGRSLASRADFFVAGRAEGLLERFDRMMLLRVLEIVESHRHARIAVNVSYETFVTRQFPASFLDLIRRLPDGCRRIILEIPSRCVMGPEEAVRPRLETLAAAGVAVAIDDFGSGACRLGVLTQWPIAMVKLDGLVTGYVDDDPLQREFVRIVTSLCRARGITTVAEYTRSAEQAARLIDDGVDLFQGEFFGMPRPAAEALATAAEAAGLPPAHVGPAV